MKLIKIKKNKKLKSKKKINLYEKISLTIVKFKEIKEEMLK